MNEVLSELLAAMPDSYQKTIGFPTYDLLAAVALRQAETDNVIADAARRLDPENLTGNDLDRYVYPRTGQARRVATFATGTLHVTGNGTVPAGAVFESGGGVQFTADRETVIAGEGDVAITCRNDGAVGNLPPGSITLLPVQIAGIVSVSNLAATSEGYDEETDKEYLARFYAKLRTPPTSGNKWHYYNWALEVAGVGDAYIEPLGHGDNTVDVVLIDGTGAPASAALVRQVQDYIDPDSAGVGAGEAPIGAHCYVSAAVAVPLEIALKVTQVSGYAQDAVTAAIRAAVTAYLGEIAFKQRYVSYAKLADAIMGAPGVLDYEGLTVNGGVANVAIGARQAATVGSLAVTYA